MSVMVKNKTNKNDKRSQKGRSMVEMLGVLAIIGVLSVGGISAYSKAVEKHKANELLHQASMLATTISAQAMTNNGTLPQTITSFGNSSYGSFSTSVTDALDGKGFSITIENVDSGACTQLEKMAGGMVREATCDGTTATITYYKNLATTEAEGEKSPTGPDPACADVICEDGLTCFHGECKCSTGLFVCGTQCCAEGTYCTQGADTSTYACTEPSGEDGECTKNSDCKDAEGNVDTTKYCKFSDAGNCSGPTGGTCTDKGALTPYTLTLPKGDLTVYKGGEMNWWSAVNFCEAHDKKQLVTMADLGLVDSGTNVACSFDKTHSNYATKPCICNGGSDSDCSATNAAILTNTGALGTSGYVWLADNYTGKSCNQRLVYLGSGAVGSLERAYTNPYALCR